MSATDLRFFKTQPVTTALRFGEIPPPGIDIYATATMAASLAVTATPALTTQLGYIASMAATVDVEITPEITAYYDNSVNRAPHLNTGSSWQVAAPANPTVAARHRISAKAEANPSPAIADGQPLPAESGIVWQQADAQRRSETAIPWTEGLYRAAAVAESWRDLFRGQRPPVVAPFENATPRPEWLTDAWQDRFRRPRPSLVVPWGEGTPLASSLTAGFDVGKPTLIYVRVPWQQGRPPPHGQHDYTVTPPAHVPCYTPNTALRFWELASTASLDLRFRCPNVIPGPGSGETIVIPILRTYIVVNDIALIRRENSLALPALALNINIDAESWTWGWQATLSALHLDDVLPASPGAPVEFEAVINGVHWYLLAERVQRDRSFGRGRIVISGRGIAAELGTPYAIPTSRTNSIDRNAQQLMDDALMINGIGIGWTLDWNLTDWLVPAGIWNHTGSHIEAVARIAVAAGGYVQAHRTSKVLAIKPRYPVAPWLWSGNVTPDFSLPAAVTTKEAVSWVDNPEYNAVYVSGESAGVLANVTRQGSAGDLVAPLIVDPLTTHADAARQRGTSILGAAGRQQIMTLETPILSNVGIYPVGSFVQFADGANSRLGIVRSLAINAGKQTRQTIEVECHSA